MTQPIEVGFALTGSFCTHQRVLSVMETMQGMGFALTPILSFNAGSLDTRFGTAAALRERLEQICGRPPIDTIAAAEPIGPKRLFDILAVAPCTGNTIAKLAGAITDTPVTMAVKSHLRSERPVVIAVSTNDALSGSAANIGTLLNRRHYYFVPMKQDAPQAKPCSLVAEMELLPETIEAALAGRQIQPLFRS